MAASAGGSRDRIVLVVALAGLLAAAGASVAAKGLERADLEQARRLYAQLKAAHDEQRSRQCLELAGTLLDYYAAFDRNDEVLDLAVESAARLGDRRHALFLTDELLGGHPDSPLVDGALERGAQLAVAGGDSLRGAHYRLLYYDRDPARGQRDDGAPRAAALFERLSAGQLADLVVFHPDSSLLPYLQCLRVRRLLDADRGADARLLVAEMEASDPEDRWTVEALGLVGVAGPLPAVASREPAGPIRLDAVGVLCPLSGRYAELGGAFREAARLAAQDANREHDRAFTLVVEDTGGDPVATALAARRLCADRGVVALFGEMLSDPTTAAAVVAGQYGTALVSPTATNERIWQIDDGVFQTNLTGVYEPRLLARLACTQLLKSSFAILNPDEPEGQRHADAFAAEVERLGGRIVARQTFPPQATDFREAVLAIRRSRPEVVFVPASPQQMVLLGPQFEFNGLGALVLGLSSWNDPRLAEHGGAALEGAVFPADFAQHPPEWAAAFAVAWPRGKYPPEADELALRTYQGMRMLLDTLAGSGARTRGGLVESLRRRLAREEPDSGTEPSHADVLRIMRDRRILPFPAELFRTEWTPAGNAAPVPEIPDRATGDGR